MLRITNLITGETERLVRDVCHEHSAWVHGQCGTGSESELQGFLDCTDLGEFQARPYEEDVFGVCFVPD